MEAGWGDDPGIDSTGFGKLIMLIRRKAGLVSVDLPMLWVITALGKSAAKPKCVRSTFVFSSSVACCAAWICIFDQIRVLGVGFRE